MDLLFVAPLLTCRQEAHGLFSRQSCQNHSQRLRKRNKPADQFSKCKSQVHRCVSQSALEQSTEDGKFERQTREIPISIVRLRNLEHDVQQCLELDQETWRGTFWSANDYVQELERECSDCLGIFLPHEDSSGLHDLSTQHGVTSSTQPQLVAALFLWTILDEASIVNLIVRPQFRRRGLARELVVYAQTVIARDARDLSFITLEVRSRNEATMNLYTSCGFQTVGRRKRYYKDPEDDAILMTWTKPEE
mmetsp:Transcript_5509/g.9798  ORF Transcript_5509/g.9798 Transcript_5509/m.9798 type:complete len:249 (-) Transcript_5509:1008-1754(-)